MSSGSIIRNHSPHQVEVSEGSRDASRRHGPAQSALPSTIHGNTATTQLKTSPPLPSASTGTQLSTVAADTTDAWFGDTDMADRLNRLRLKNKQLNQQLSRTERSGRNEDPHE